MLCREKHSSKISSNLAKLLPLLALQSCPTLCDPTDGSPSSSPVPGILQARTLEWVAISFSNARMHAKSLQSCPTVQPHDSSPPGSSVHGILQARVLSWHDINSSHLMRDTLTLLFLSASSRRVLVVPYLLHWLYFILSFESLSFSLDIFFFFFFNFILFLNFT